jgi:hypothetical protein
MKYSKPFTFLFPLSHKVVREFKIVTEHVGDLEVSGTAYFNPEHSMLDIFERYHADVDFIKWNGTNIKEVLEVLSGIEEIEEAAAKHAAYVFAQVENDLYERRSA